MARNPARVAACCVVMGVLVTGCSSLRCTDYNYFRPAPGSRNYSYKTEGDVWDGPALGEARPGSTAFDRNRIRQSSSFFISRVPSIKF